MMISSPSTISGFSVDARDQFREHEGGADIREQGQLSPQPEETASGALVKGKPLFSRPASRAEQDGVCAPRKLQRRAGQRLPGRLDAGRATGASINSRGALLQPPLGAP